jgi:restriction endonuclease Mrr
MAIPDYQTLMLPVLRLAATGEQRVADAAERIADDVGLSPAEREEGKILSLQGGPYRLAKAWAFHRD